MIKRIDERAGSHTEVRHLRKSLAYSTQRKTRLRVQEVRGVWVDRKTKNSEETKTAHQSTVPSTQLAKRSAKAIHSS